MLTRGEFLTLTKLDDAGLKALARRDQLPFASRDERRAHGQYSETEAFLTLIALELNHGSHIARTAAADIARALPQVLRREWSTIAAYVTDPSNPEIMCGRITLPYPVGDRPFCGTSSEKDAAGAPRVREDSINASRAAAVLAMRASREGISLSDDFWTFGPEIG